jgi:hypothetical protein
MSIFKSTLHPTIAAQLKAREKILHQSDTLREGDFLRFTTGKNSWVRMISMVDYDSKVFDKKSGTWKNDDRYKGTDLCKKYILEGGTLYNQRLRRNGVNKSDTTYGSDIDRIGINSKKLNRQFGIRPMPGITSVNIYNKSAYGSLREAVVNFYAWDKKQLEELEVLFMRPGYSVWLEWGWAQYLDHGDAKQGVNTYPDDIKIKNFDTRSPDVFSPNTEDYYYQAIDQLVLKTKGNSDAMIGFVKNFSWQLMSNGGFQCSTTIISRGEVLEGIKASANPQTVLESITPAQTSENDKPPVSFFENIFLTIKGHINNSEFFVSGAGEFYNQDANASSTAVNRVNTYFESIISGLKQDTFLYKWHRGGNVEKHKGYSRTVWGGVLPAEGSTDGSGIEYINLDLFIAILQRYLIAKNEQTGEPLLYLILPGDTPCLISEDTVSIDPTVCMIKNQFATFVTEDPNGFSPSLYTSFSSNSDGTTLKPGSLFTPLTFPLDTAVKTKEKEIPDPDDQTKTKTVSYNIVNIGEIGSIYVSIGKIIQTYRDLSNEDGVNVIDLLKSLLESISFSLGGINDFKLYTDKNNVQIIDAKYLEEGETSNNKFKFDLIGLKSIVRDVKINSRIFSEQSTMIAIGAANSKNNIGDVYSSTQTLFNTGLTDRVIRNVTFSETKQNTSGVKPNVLTDEDKYYLQIYNNVKMLSSYLKRKVLGTPRSAGYVAIKTPSPEEISNAGSLLKTLIYQLNGKDIDFKALIPFELEITLDGISGFIIGQIFTIDKSILPKDYYNKNLGFIITGISHALQNNDWTTVIKTQICMLDNEEYPVSVDKALLKSKIEQIEKVTQTNTYLFFALTDYIIFLIVKMMCDEPNEKTPFISSTIETANNSSVFNLSAPSGMDLDYFDFDDRYKAVKAVKDDYLTKSPKSSYITSWFSMAKTLGLPNFPATLDELYSATTPSGKKYFPVVIDVVFDRDFKKWLWDEEKWNEGNNQSQFDWEKHFFLYKFFGKDPIKYFQENGLILPGNKFSLNQLHAEVLKKVQEYVFSQKNQDLAAIYQSNTVPIFSLECDVTKQTLLDLESAD